MKSSALLILETKNRSFVAVRPEVIPEQKRGGRGVRLAANAIVRKVGPISFHLILGESMGCSCKNCGVEFTIEGNGTLQTFSPICARCAGD